MPDPSKARGTPEEVTRLIRTGLRISHQSHPGSGPGDPRKRRGVTNEHATPSDLIATQDSSSSPRSLAFLLACVVPLGCSRSKQPEKTVIQNTGSDTMVNLAQAWAEEYAKVDPTSRSRSPGGGSGTGIAALINGTVDIANCSRKVEPQEVEQAKKNTGKEPREFMVGYDALAVYVHKDNPLEEITLEQLAEIYGEGGKTVAVVPARREDARGADEIIRVSRQSNSGTYAYFREAILGKGRDFKLGRATCTAPRTWSSWCRRRPARLATAGWATRRRTSRCCGSPGRRASRFRADGREHA